jgi:lysine-ketoglutarate reductase/saccharopine dehydrogenase-like protein (TIGR00300 family)
MDLCVGPTGATVAPRYLGRMVSETVELRGHIIDSLILPKVLDAILAQHGNFKISEIKIGQNRADQSYARIEVSADSNETLDDLILRLRQHGAEVVEHKDAQLAAAPADGVFPTDFYVTNNQQTFVQIAGKELEVRPVIMDSGIVIDRTKKRAAAVKFYDLKRGMEVVVGHQGIKVVPVQRSTSRTDIFEFMASNVAVERPKSAVIAELAREFNRAREEGGKILFVAGSAVVQSGAGEHLEKLIEWGYVDLLFGGNALALHDIENALFGTSLGVDLERAPLTNLSHENQMHAINAIRAAGGIARAVEKNVLQRGVMFSCVHHQVPFLLAGSIRDEGPLPEVITDAIEAQKAMREKISGVKIALLMSSMLHSMSVVSLLAADVKTLCVDINPSAISQLTDRSTFQTVGLVTDIEPFLRELTGCLEKLRAPAKRSSRA